MPRIARGLSDGALYHVINRGNARQEVFHKDEDYQAIINLMVEAKERYEVEVCAYCFMPNHFHLLLRPVQGEELSKWMQWLMTSHVRRYHKHYKTSGHVWQGRYKSFIVAQDDHLLTVVRYIEGNPLRAGLASSAANWPWSSHCERCECRGSSFLGKLPLALPTNWAEYVDTPLTTSELERLLVSTNRQTPFGKASWQNKMCRKHGLESTMRPQGRPRKRE